MIAYNKHYRFLQTIYDPQKSILSAYEMVREKLFIYMTYEAVKLGKICIKIFS